MANPKVMLHPALAGQLRERREPIEANVAGFFSWSRLTEILRRDAEVAHDEEVEAYVLTDTGVQFFAKRRR